MNNLDWRQLLAGVSGGVISTLVLHPLDLVKIRLCVNDGLVTRPTYKGLTDTFFSVVRNEGVYALYKGCSPNIVGAGASWGFYFFFYGAIKSFLLSDGRHTLPATTHMMAGAEAGIMTLCLTNPIWVAKTRMCLQYPGSPTYTGLIHCLRSLWLREGLRGYYSGFVPGLFGVSHGAIQFMVYEEFKKLYASHYNLDPLNIKLASSWYVLFAALSKLLASGSTYPYQVVRARLQDQHTKYSGVFDVTTKTWRREGFYGFYKGLYTNLLRVVPATCITFVVYENLFAFLQTF